MKWDYKHNEICCEIYVTEVINKRSDYSTADRCVELAKMRGLPQSEGSIRMKFSNIRAICDEMNIEHNSPFKPLTNYTKRNKLAFESIISNGGLK